MSVGVHTYAFHRPNTTKS